MPLSFERNLAVREQVKTLIPDRLPHFFIFPRQRGPSPLPPSARALFTPPPLVGAPPPMPPDVVEVPPGPVQVVLAEPIFVPAPVVGVSVTAPAPEVVVVVPGVEVPPPVVVVTPPPALPPPAPVIPPHMLDLVRLRYLYIGQLEGSLNESVAFTVDILPFPWRIRRITFTPMNTTADNVRAWLFMCTAYESYSSTTATGLTALPPGLPASYKLIQPGQAHFAGSPPGAVNEYFGWQFADSGSVERWDFQVVTPTYPVGTTFAVVIHMGESATWNLAVAVEVEDMSDIPVDQILVVPPPSPPAPPGDEPPAEPPVAPPPTEPPVTPPGVGPPPPMPPPPVGVTPRTTFTFRMSVPAANVYGAPRATYDQARADANAYLVGFFYRGMYVLVTRLPDNVVVFRQQNVSSLPPPTGVGSLPPQPPIGAG